LRLRDRVQRDSQRYRRLENYMLAAGVTAVIVLATWMLVFHR
jgi:hypothetical protein